MLNSFKLTAGHFKGRGNFLHGQLMLTPINSNKIEKISVNLLKDFDVAREDNVKDFGGSLSKGLVAGFVFGGTGAIAGALSGGNKREITVIGEFEDGRKFMAVMNDVVYNRIQRAVFDKNLGILTVPYESSLSTKSLKSLFYWIFGAVALLILLSNCPKHDDNSNFKPPSISQPI